MGRARLGEEEAPLDPFVEYERALRIDRNDLDTELVQQPDMYYRISREMAMSISRRDAAKLERDRTEAEVDLSLRHSHAADEKKPMESFYRNKVLLDTDFIDSQDKYIEACGTADRWQALKDAFSQRAYALKDLVSLYQTGYFTNSSASGERTAARDRLAEGGRETLDRARRARKEE